MKLSLITLALLSIGLARAEELSGLRHRDEYVALLRTLMPVRTAASAQMTLVKARLPELSSLEGLDAGYAQNLLQYSFLHCETRAVEESRGTNAGDEAAFFGAATAPADRVWVESLARRLWGRNVRSEEVSALLKSAESMSDSVTLLARKTAVCALALAAPEIYLK